jgi:hypothetical protein
MKVCKKCGVEKELTEFHNSANTRDGKKSTCKACARANTQKWLDEHPGYGQRYYEAHRDEIAQKYRDSHPLKEKKPNKTDDPEYSRNYYLANKERIQAKIKKKSAEYSAREELPAPPEKKRCRQCGAIKPGTEFTKDRSRKEGITSMCRECDSKRTSAYNKKNPNAQTQRGKASRKRHMRVAGKIVRKCPLTTRWLVTSDECRRLLRQAVRDYLSKKKGLGRLICVGGIEELPPGQPAEGVYNLSEKISCYGLAYIFTSLCPLPFTHLLCRDEVLISEIGLSDDSLESMPAVELAEEKGRRYCLDHAGSGGLTCGESPSAPARRLGAGTTGGLTRRLPARQRTAALRPRSGTGNRP